MVFALVVLCLSTLPLAPQTALAEVDPAVAEKDAAIDQRLGAKINLDLAFRETTGKSVKLNELIGKDRPAIIVPVYFTCPRLCSLTQTGVADLINSLPLKLREDYSVLSISIRSEDTLEQSKAKADEFRGKLATGTDVSGWHFLTAEPAAVTELMSQLGFHYLKDQEEFAHAASIMILTPDGTISRYFFGVEFPSRDVRYALVDASSGKIGTLADHIFLFCFRFDPTKGKYTLIIWKITQLICGLIVVLVVSLLLFLKIKEAKTRG